MTAQTDPLPLSIRVAQLAAEARAEHLAQGLYTEHDEVRLAGMDLAELLPETDQAAEILAARRAVNGMTDPNLSFQPGAGGLKGWLAKRLWPLLAPHIDAALFNQHDINNRHVELLNRLCEGHERNLIEIDRTNRMLTDQLDLLDRNLSRLSNRLSSLSRRMGRLSAPESAAPAGERDRVWLTIEEETGGGPAMDYVAFEDQNRGPEELVRGKQKPYVELFRDPPGPVLDLGCGRGEFLELLVEADIPARGVDSNPEMVAEAASKGLAVTEADGIAFLRVQPEGSLGGLFMAQVIEHLTLDRLTELLRLAHRALAPGAVVVAETVNPESLVTFARTFYKDPTHVKPIHPEAARFIWSAAGFEAVDILRLNPVGEEERLLAVDPRFAGAESLNRNIKALNRLLFGPQDFAVVGRRP